MSGWKRIIFHLSKPSILYYFRINILRVAVKSPAVSV